MRVTLGAERWTALDWVPVVAVAALSQLAIGLEQPWAGSDPGLALTSALLALPLLWRRRWPLAVAVVVAAALPVQVALGGSLGFGSFCAILFAAFAVGCHTRGWPPAVAGTVVVLGGAFMATLDGLRESPSDAVFPLFYLGAAALLGRVVRHLAAQAEDLRRLNTALGRERENAERLAVATERMRLARELHDVVAHTMTVMVIQAAAAEESLDGDPAAARRSLARIAEAGRGGLSDLRSLVRVLRSSDENPLPPGLSDLDALAAVLADGGLEASVERVGALDDVPSEVGAVLFRVVQESLTNVLKHSSARTVSVRLSREAESVAVSVVDPGPVAETAGLPGGHGLAGMAERISACGGTLTAARHEGGFRVGASVPLSGSRTVAPAADAAPVSAVEPAP